MGETIGERRGLRVAVRDELAMELDLGLVLE